MTIIDKTLCSGCGACSSCCPSGAVLMERDSEGFIYPQIDESKCTQCGKCKTICPIEKNSVSDMEYSGAVYALRALDEEVVNISTSGGAFSILAEDVIAQGGAVYGAGFDTNHAVLHKRIDTIEEIKQLTGSKYVQSYLGDTYKNIKKDLDSGHKVMFVGTPCQCAGLRTYLHKYQENLLLVDFVCHGVPSPKLYSKYLEYMSRVGEIESLSFRDKTEDDSRQYIGIRYRDGSAYRRYTPEDPYMLGFIQNISLRRSCYSCAFKGLTSGSDITLGDFWGIEDTDSPLKGKNGVSLFVVNTEKGEKAFLGIKDKTDFDKRTLEEALKQNSSIKKSVPENPLRDKFLGDMDKLPIDKLCEKYCGNSMMAKMRRYFARRKNK